MGCAWISDEEAKEEPNPSQPRSPPYNSPFNHAEEFGITEKTTKFMGLDEQAYAERIVPAVRLDLEEATGEELESEMAQCFIKLEEKCAGWAGIRCPIFIER